MLKILLADDHEIVRGGLKLFIKTFFAHAVIDDAWDGDSTLEKVKANDYQLIILDVNMPGTDSFELIHGIISSKPDANILIFSMNPEDTYAKRYLQAGAKGYVSKGSSTTELGNAINTVLKNKRYISPSLSQAIAGEISGERTMNPFDTLSSREFEIAQHLIKGEGVSEIRNMLHLKASTVSTYKARIFEKLKCKNPIELNQLARVYNIIPSA